MPDRCHWVREQDGTETLIPGCWGSVHDPANCTCEVPGSALDRAERARQAAEAEVERLREKLARAADRVRELMTRNARLHDKLTEARKELVGSR
jgi:peptidoglycan hydrolase CwlO-like protein